jgi:CheY-like chemotaxis protein
MSSKRLRYPAPVPAAEPVIPSPEAVASASPGTETSAASPLTTAMARVLLAEESLPYRRVIREALSAFRLCEVDDTPSGEHAFEMALRRPYSLFIFAMPLPDLAGDLLDRLLCKAYPLAHPRTHAAPPVIYLTRPTDMPRFEQMKRDVRVRGSLSFPPRLDALLALTAPLLPARPGLPATGLLPMPFAQPPKF